MYLEYLIEQNELKLAREVFKRALEYTKDYPQEIARRYLEFENSHGTLEDITQSIVKIHKNNRRTLEKPKRQIKDAPKLASIDEIKRHTIFVRPIPLKMKESELQEIFSQVVSVKACRIVRNRDGKSRGYGYIDLNSEQDVIESIRVLNGFEIQGARVLVAASKPPEENKNDKFLVFVNNLPFEISEDELREVMGQFGDISSIRIIKDTEGKCKGYAYVEFNEKESIDNAIKLGQITIKNRKVLLLKSNTEKTSKYTLHVSNLPYTIDEDKLIMYFNGCSKITLPKDKENKPRGFAFIEFDKEEDAQNALESEFPVIEGRPVVIKKCGKVHDQKRGLKNSDFKKFLI